MNHTSLSPVHQHTHPQEFDQLTLPCLDIDTEGRITYANRACLAAHHPEAGSLVGKHIWEFVALDEKDLSRVAFQALIQAGGEPPAITRNIFDHSGNFRTYQLHRAWIRDAAGRPVGIRLLGVDVTDITQALDESRRTCQWLESAMTSMRDAVILTDALGIVRSVNPAAGELVGRRAEDLVGLTMEEALPVLDDRAAEGATFDLKIAIEQHWKGAATLVSQEGEKTRIEIGTSPIIDTDNGSLSGVIAILRKIDDAG